MATSSSSTPATTLLGLNSGPSIGSGELSALLGADPNHDYTMIKYPLELASAADDLHYVTFFINLPVQSKYVVGGKNIVSNQNGTIATTTNYSITTNAAGGARGQLNQTNVTAGAAASTLLNGQGLVQGAIEGGGGGAINNALINLQPKLARIKTAISIYMPDTIQVSYSHSYQEESLTEAQGKLGQAAMLGAGGMKDIQAVFSKSAPGKYTSPVQYEAITTAGEGLGIVGPGYKDIALKSINAAVNPQIELIYKGTANREFVFEFRFQARSKQEADEIKQIIYTFRRFSAPELQGNNNGRYFTVPASFDIKFYFGFAENTNISRISTCVLQNMTVDYSGAGQYATFNDGMSVQINLALTFKEVDIITRELIEQQGY